MGKDINPKNIKVDTTKIKGTGITDITNDVIQPIAPKKILETLQPLKGVELSTDNSQSTDD